MEKENLNLEKQKIEYGKKLSTVIKLDLEKQELRELKISFEGANWK